MASTRAEDHEFRGPLGRGPRQRDLDKHCPSCCNYRWQDLARLRSPPIRILRIYISIARITVVAPFTMFLKSRTRVFKIVFVASSSKTQVPRKQKDSPFWERREGLRCPGCVERQNSFNRGHHATRGACSTGGPVNEGQCKKGCYPVGW